MCVKERIYACKRGMKRKKERERAYVRGGEKKRENVCMCQRERKI